MAVRVLVACWGVFTGTVAVGGTCQIDFECADGAYCGSGKCTAGT